MKRMNVLLIVLLLVLGGCASITSHKEMFTGPNFQQLETKKFADRENKVVAEIGNSTFQGVYAEVTVKGNGSVSFAGRSISSPEIEIKTNNASFQAKRERNSTLLKDPQISVRNGTISFDNSSMKVKNQVMVTGEKARFLVEEYNATRSALPEKLTNVKFRLSPRLDVADSAFLYDLGIKTPSYSWKAVMWEKIDGEWQTRELKAVRMRHKRGPPELLITIPAPLKNIKGNYLAVIDHGGNRVYNRKGQFLVKDWRDIDPRKTEFLTRIDDDSNPLQVKKGEEDYWNIIDFYKKFRALEALQLKSYIYRQEGIPAGTTLSREEVKKIAEKYESYTSKLKELFLDDWYVLFTYPLLSPVEYGSYIMVSKLFQIPSVWWEKDLDSPGYMDRKLTAAGGYDMMSYFAQNYLRGGGASSTGKLTPKQQEVLKKATGKQFSTYEEYLNWVIRQNREIERHNQGIEKFGK